MQRGVSVWSWRVCKTFTCFYHTSCLGNVTICKIDTNFRCHAVQSFRWGSRRSQSQLRKRLERHSAGRKWPFQRSWNTNLPIVSRDRILELHDQHKPSIYMSKSRPFIRWEKMLNIEQTFLLHFQESTREQLHCPMQYCRASHPNPVMLGQFFLSNLGLTNAKSNHILQIVFETSRHNSARQVVNRDM